MKYLNVYEVSREYGGPEEGGWWFDAGRHVPELSSTYPDLLDPVLTGVADMLRIALDEEANENGVPKVHSVLYRGGRYSVAVEDKPGADYPAERPVYS